MYLAITAAIIATIYIIAFTSFHSYYALLRKRNLERAIKEINNEISDELVEFSERQAVSIGSKADLEMAIVEGLLAKTEVLDALKIKTSLFRKNLQEV